MLSFVSDQNWQIIDTNFVTNIPIALSINFICKVIDCLFIKYYYITTNKKNNTKKQANLFEHYIVKLYNLCKFIILDCGTYFVTNF